MSTRKKTRRVPTACAYRHAYWGPKLRKGCFVTPTGTVCYVTTKLPASVFSRRGEAGRRYKVKCR